MVEQNGGKFRRLEKVIKKITFDLNSNSTDLSFSGEEGHSAVLLAHFMFWFQLRTKLFSNAGYAAKLHKKCQETLLCCAICIFSHQTKYSFCFSEQLSLQKATLDSFFEQLFEKLQENFWNSSSNLWKALT